MKQIDVSKPGPAPHLVDTPGSNYTVVTQCAAAPVERHPLDPRKS